MASRTPPLEHTVTASSGCVRSASIKADCKVYYIKPELFELGKAALKTPARNIVPVYDLERTICDVIRNRNIAKQKNIPVWVILQNYKKSICCFFNICGT